MKLASLLSPRAFAVAAACVGLFLALAPSVRADASPAAPLKPTCMKAEGDKGPYTLALQNTGEKDLSASASVQKSVASHGDRKTRDVGPMTVKAGDTWTIDSLAAGDKVTVTVAGYAPLVVSIP
jgi:hypothetical protein